MKKFFSLMVITALLVVTLSGCISDKDDTALVISGTEINNEIYAYYLDVVEQRPEDYGLTADFTDEQAQDAAVDLCVRYIAFNTEFADRKLSLSVQDKVTISEKTDNIWTRAENHYNQLGISKQTITKIMTSEAYESLIFEAIYDKGVDDEDSEKLIQEYFYNNFTAFRNICAYYTTADGSSRISEQERLNLVEMFNGIATDAGDTDESFSNTCDAYGYTMSETVVLESDSDGYPEGFFDSVYVMDVGTVAVAEYDDCIFCVRKEDLKEMGEAVYANYRSYCIEKMYADDWQKMTDSFLDKYTVDEIKV